MLKVILIVICIGLILYCIRQLMFGAKPSIKTTLKWVGLLTGATFGLLAVTGKLHLLSVLLAGLIPVVRTIGPWIWRFLPNLLGHAQARAQQTAPPPNASVTTHMTLEEAYEVLDLTAEATKEQVIERHKLLIQKNHPDRGGSDYLAAKINLAKKVILEHLAA